MNQGFIKVAAGTPQVTVADCKANTRAILEVIREMETQHAKLMVLPELCITGYTCQDLFLQRRLLDSAWESLLTIAEETARLDEQQDAVVSMESVELDELAKDVVNNLRDHAEKKNISLDYCGIPINIQGVRHELERCNSSRRRTMLSVTPIREDTFIFM